MKYLTFLLISGLLVEPAAQAHEGSHASATTTAAVPAPRLQATLRALWHGHVEKTREYAFAVKAGDGKRSEAAANAVVANAKQLANAVGSFYGAAADERMLALLAGHWGAVKAMTDAGHAGDRAAVNAAMSTLTQNADEISVFLAGANPYLPKDAVRGLLVAHGAHHAAQIGEVMRGDRKAEATTWAAMQKHMDVIADAMAGALAKQFPGKAA
ncbi:hypothetical protein ACFPOA_02460 [Lysobacter niabensis]|uniref:hypothetical protein n=1 Tax=Agrilutibacter niabensis TaxID=380628 RepID=UPI0036228CDF